MRPPNDHGQCCQCGWCCTVRACWYGEWDAANGRCAFLTPEAKCSRHAVILEAEAHSAYPMFGSGCSSSMFNDVRDRKLRETADFNRPSDDATLSSPRAAGNVG